MDHVAFVLLEIGTGNGLVPDHLADGSPLTTGFTKETGALTLHVDSDNMQSDLNALAQEGGDAQEYMTRGVLHEAVHLSGSHVARIVLDSPVFAGFTTCLGLLRRQRRGTSSVSIPLA